LVMADDKSVARSLDPSISTVIDMCSVSYKIQLATTLESCGFHTKEITMFN
jgi:hypothetical protein